jgi:hypothetical protein
LDAKIVSECPNLQDGGDGFDRDCVLSQILSHKIKDIVAAAQRDEAAFMLHRVPKISMYFQRSPISVGDSMQHGCNMKCAKAERNDRSDSSRIASR